MLEEVLACSAGLYLCLQYLRLQLLITQAPPVTTQMGRRACKHCQDRFLVPENTLLCSSKHAVLKKRGPPLPSASYILGIKGAVREDAEAAEGK